MRSVVGRMPPDLGRLRDCFGPTGKSKVAYSTKKEAVTAAAEMQARCGSNRRPYRAYPCDVHGYHIGRRPAK